MLCVREMFLVETVEGFEFLLGSRGCGIKAKHERKGNVPLIEQILQKQEVRVRMNLEGSCFHRCEMEGQPDYHIHSLIHSLISSTNTY